MRLLKNIFILFILTLTSTTIFAQCCGDGICDPSETAVNCPYDCATSSFNCGNTIGSFYNSPTWPVNSATAQSNGWCYTLTPPYPSQVCFEYVVPNVGDSASVSFSISACGGSSVNQSNYPPFGGCNNAGYSSGTITGVSTYDNNCSLVSSAITTGGPGCYNPGDIITICLDINPATACSQIIICPVIACGQTNCATTGTTIGCPPFSFTQNSIANPCDSTNGTAIVTPACGSHFTYLWDDSLAQTDSMAIGLNPGTYNVIITNSAFGCDTTITVVVPNSLPLNITQDNQSICHGDSIFLAGNFEFNAGIYSDTLIGISGCDSILQTNLSVDPLPIIITNPDTAICAGSSVTISANGCSVYNWNNGLGAGQFHVVSPTFPMNYQVTGIDTNGCSDTSSVNIQIEQNTIADAGFDQELCEDESTSNLSANTPLFSSENGSWSLLSGNGLIDDFNDPNSSVSNLILGSNIFAWTITNMVCPNSTDSVIITLVQCETSSVLIPNIFTPNNDGSNDFFTVKSVNLESLECEIYNRWGQFLYSWNQVNGGWNGRTNDGVKVPDGTYFYIIKAIGNDGEEFIKKGSFSLIR
jgi:gliding motility-associated-like protein